MLIKYIKILLVIPLVLSNTGHRLGKGSVKGYPENTIEILNKSLSTNLHNKKGFLYWEFDIRETADNIIVVHHNNKIKGEGIVISQSSYKTISAINLWDCCKIPTPIEVLETLEHRYEGKVAIEIKHLRSDTARNSLVDLLRNYNKNKLKVIAIASKSNFNKSFPGDLKNKYCQEFRVIGLIKKHYKNLCEKYL